MEATSGAEILIAVSDIHGQLEPLKSLFQNLERCFGQDQMLQAGIVFLGDYCDRGAETKGVLDWLVQFKQERLKHGGTEPQFLAGNHDFGMACFLGVVPADPGTFQYSREDLEPSGEAPLSAKEFHKQYKDSGTPAYGGQKLHCRNNGGLSLDSLGETRYLHPFVGGEGYFGSGVSLAEQVLPHGMHGIGRRWGGSDSFQASPTFLSYLTEEDRRQAFVQEALNFRNGVIDGRSHASKFRDLIIRRVSECNGHLDFLQSMKWIVDVNLQGLVGLTDLPGFLKKPSGPEKSRVILTHAGLISEQTAAEQENDINALKNQDLWCVRLFETEAAGEKAVGRFAHFQGRGEVLATPIDSAAYHVSGHHGNRASRQPALCNITDKARGGSFGQKRVIIDYSGDGKVCAVVLREGQPVELVSSSNLGCCELPREPFFHSDKLRLQSAARWPSEPFHMQEAMDDSHKRSRCQ